MKLQNAFIIVLSITLSLNIFGQHTITGNFPPIKGQQVSLVGFKGFKIYTIDSTKVSEQGVFKLNYTETVPCGHVMFANEGSAVPYF